MCCNKNVSKALLIIINSLFLLFGGASLAAGVFVNLDKTAIMETLNKMAVNISSDVVDEVIGQTSLLEDSAIALIVAGGIIFIISALGFFGACKSNKVMLYIYSIVVLLIFCAEIAAGVLGYIYKDRLDTYFRDFLNDTIVEKYDSGTFGTSGTSVIVENVEPVSAAWDFTMYFFQCCGNGNYTDFVDYAQNWNRQVNYTDSSGNLQTVTAVVPITCCKATSASSFPDNIQFENLGDCLVNGTSTTTNHADCYTKLIDLFTQYAYICLGVGIGVALIEITGIFAACCLVRAINKEGKDFA